MTKKQIEEIKARCEAATPGPLIVTEVNRFIFQWEVVTKEGDADGDRTLVAGSITHCPNAYFIAHARTDIPALIEALESSQRENGILRVALSQYANKEEYVLTGTDMIGGNIYSTWHDGSIAVEALAKVGEK